jgi:hypothetical protein
MGGDSSQPRAVFVSFRYQDLVCKYSRREGVS